MTTEIDAEGLAAATGEMPVYLKREARQEIAKAVITAYLSASRSTSEAEPVALEAAAEDLPTFLLWVAESYEAHAKVSEHLDEIDGYIGSANMARAHLAKLTLPATASDDQVGAAVETAVRAAYARGYEWRGENPDAESYLPKAAADYADKVMHDREGPLFNALAAMGSTKK